MGRGRQSYVIIFRAEILEQRVHCAREKEIETKCYLKICFVLIRKIIISPSFFSFPRIKILHSRKYGLSSHIGAGNQNIKT